MRVIDRRTTTAHKIGDMRPTDDNVHVALLETTALGVTYDRLAELANADAQNVVMWSAGARIPTSVEVKRRILAACVQALSMPMDTMAARIVSRAAARSTPKPAPLRVVTRAPLCCVCMANTVTDNVRDICGRANCYRRYEEQRRIAAMHGG